MGQPVLSAIITADGGRFTKTLGELEAQLKRFQSGLKSAGNTESFNRLNRAAEETKRRIDALKGVGNPLRPIQGGANEATQSMINLGRVVQDAPYGFIGIANNLNPLIEGFGRTSKAAGGFGGAMKAMGKSLIGPGGIGLAVSVISSALVLFGDKIFGASKQAGALDTSLKESAKSIAEEAVRLTTLVGLIQNTNTSNADREKGLKAINQEYGKYLKNLGIEEVGLNNIKEAYDKIIDNLLRQAVIKGLQEEITAAVEETAKSLLKLEVEEEKRKQKSKPAITADQKRAQELKNLNQQLQSNQRATSDGFIAQSKANLVYDAGVNKLATYDERLKLLKEALTRQLTPLLNVTSKFEDLGITLDKAGEKTESIIDKAKKLADFFNKTTIRDISFEVDPTQSTKENEQRARDFIDKVLDPIRRTEFRVKPEINVRPEFKLDLQRIELFKSRSENAKEATKTFDQVEKEFVDQLNKLGANNRFVLKLNADVKIGQDFEKRLEEAAGQLNAAATNFISNSFESIGEDIASVLSGKNFGAGLIEALSSFIINMGKALIQFGIIKSSFDKILKVGLGKISGVAAIALGIAAVAIGNLIKNSSQNIAGFRAVGGPVGAGRSYVVGEKGPEIFVPNTGGSIIPNHKLGTGAMSAVGGQSLNLGGQFVIQGKDLVLLLSQVTKSQGRVT